MIYKDKQSNAGSGSKDPANELRKQAGEIAPGKFSQTAENFEALSPEDARKLLHELQARQIELEMQNEELRRALKELDISRARYFDLYDLAPVAYLTISEKGLILEANLTASDILGTARSELVNQPLIRFIINEDQDIYNKLLKKLFDTGETKNFEIRMIGTDGEFLWVYLQTTVEADNDGANICRAVISNISGRKFAEASLRESEERLELAQSAAKAGVWDWDIVTGRIQWSKHMFELFGLDPLKHTASFDTWKSIVHPDDIVIAGKRIEQSLKEKSTLNSDYRIIMPNGQIRWINAVGQGKYNDQGQAVRMIGICIDITERKQVEEVQAFLARTSSDTAEEFFFNALARYLSRSLDMDFVCIDRLEGDGLNARTVAVWCDGRFEDNVTYALKDTPCGEVVGKNVCCFPASVCQYFPRDQVLQELRAESYIGVTLWSHTGNPIGLIAVISRKPLANRSFAEATLQLVSARAAGEIERLDAEKALRESEERFQQLFDHMADGVVVYKSIDDGNDFVILDMNKTGVNLTAVTWEDVIGKRIAEVFPSVKQMGLLEALRRVWQTGNHENLPLTKYKDGRVEVWVESYIYKLPSGLIVVIFSDTTEKHRIESALRESEVRYRRLFESSKEGILILEAETGIVLDTNPFLISMLGISREQLAGKKVWEQSALKEIIFNQQVFQELQIEEYMRYDEASLNTVDGHRIDVEFVCNAFFVDEKKVIQCNIRDVTQRKRAEEELLKKMDELQRFHNLTVGRELTMIELKKEVNELLKISGQKEKYRIVE